MLSINHMFESDKLKKIIKDKFRKQLSSSFVGGNSPAEFLDKKKEQDKNNASYDDDNYRDEKIEFITHVFGSGVRHHNMIK